MCYHGEIISKESKKHGKLTSIDSISNKESRLFLKILPVGNYEMSFGYLSS